MLLCAHVRAYAGIRTHVTVIHAHKFIHHKSNAFHLRRITIESGPLVHSFGVSARKSFYSRLYNNNTCSCCAHGIMPYFGILLQKAAKKRREKIIFGSFIHNCARMHNFGSEIFRVTVEIHERHWPNVWINMDIWHLAAFSHFNYCLVTRKKNSSRNRTENKLFVNDSVQALSRSIPHAVKQLGSGREIECERIHGLFVWKTKREARRTNISITCLYCTYTNPFIYRFIACAFVILHEKTPGGGLQCCHNLSHIRTYERTNERTHRYHGTMSYTHTYEWIPHIFVRVVVTSELHRLYSPLQRTRPHRSNVKTCVLAAVQPNEHNFLFCLVSHFTRNMCKMDMRYIRVFGPMLPCSATAIILP